MKKTFYFSNHLFKNVLSLAYSVSLRLVESVVSRVVKNVKKGPVNKQINLLSMEYLGHK